MTRIVKPKAVRRTTTHVSINREALKMAREPGVNVSAVREETLARRVAAGRRKAWLRENALAIAAYNDYVEENGAFPADSRGF